MAASATKLKSSQLRRAREREILRQEILDAARRLFIREGYENVSMRRVAEKIGYSPTTIYLYFKDKSDLIFALCEESFARLVSELQSLESSVADPVEKLRKGLWAYVNFGLRNPNHYLLSFVIPHGEWEDRERHLNPEAMGMKAFAFLPKLIGECVQQGRFRPVDVREAGQALWAAVHGVTSLLITHEEFPWVEREALINRVIGSAIGGLAA